MYNKIKITIQFLMLLGYLTANAVAADGGPGGISQQIAEASALANVPS